MKTIKIIAAIALIAFCIATEPSGAATRNLSIATAHRGITTYEQIYWRDQGAKISVSRCKRRSSRQVTCIAIARMKGKTVEVEDWATLIQHGAIRIHPGKFAIEEVME